MTIHQIETTGVVRDDGTIVVFKGRFKESQVRCIFGVDHRYAQALVDALYNDDIPVADVPEWAVISRG